MARRSTAQKSTDPGSALKPAEGNQAQPTRTTQLDRLIHPHTRLAIVSALAANQAMSFNDLKRLLRTTDGTLSVHTRKLEDANYIKCVKSFQGRMPHTEFSLTPDGRAAFEKYISHMEAIIEAAREK